MSGFSGLGAVIIVVLGLLRPRRRPALVYFGSLFFLGPIYLAYILARAFRKEVVRVSADRISYCRKHFGITTKNTEIQAKALEELHIASGTYASHLALVTDNLRLKLGHGLALEDLSSLESLIRFVITRRKLPEELICRDN